MSHKKLAIVSPSTIPSKQLEKIWYVDGPRLRFAFETRNTLTLKSELLRIGLLLSSCRLDYSCTSVCVDALGPALSCLSPLLASPALQHSSIVLDFHISPTDCSCLLVCLDA